MSDHLNDKQINAYIHQTLTDDQREVMERHLTDCQICRSKLADYTALQQRIRQTLLTDLRSIQPSAAMTFSTVVPQLRQRRPSMFRRFALRIAAAVMAAALIIMLAISANNSQPTTVFTSSALAANQTTTFATLGSTSNPGNGWFLAGTAPQNYEAGIDHVVVRDGKSSGYISSTVYTSEGFGTWMQMFKADDYRGKRLRLSADIKAEHVDNWAGVWMRIDGPENEMVGFDNMQNRPIRGTIDWQKVAIVLDVPPDSVDIAFGVLLQGVGRVWIDNVRFEVVGQDVPTTQLKEDTTPPVPQPINLGFEAGLNGWSSESTSQDYTIDTDPKVAHSGQASGHIQSKATKPLGAGSLGQYIKADNYRGRQVHVTGYAKFDGAAAAARFVVYVFDPHNMTLQVGIQPIYSTAVWQKQDTTLYVPENGDRIAYGIQLEGQGQVWLDDVQVEVIDLQVIPAPQDRTVEQQPANLDFETGSTGWSAADSNTRGYVSGIDPAVAHLGRASGSIESLGLQPAGLGLLRQSVKADPYRDKRVRISGYLRADRLNGMASFLLTIYNQQDQMIYANSRSIGSSTDWRWFDFVLNVPANSDRLEYGLALRGEGQDWIDDVSIEFVGDGVEISSFETSPLQYGAVGSSRPDNLGFESGTNLQSWFNSGNADYEIGVDHGVKHGGSASAYIKAKETISGGSYEVLSQFIQADDYRGKRLRLSSYIRANQVEGWAGIWMNIAGSGNQMLGLDNMQNRPITGTSDWQKYEIVLDIPADGMGIGFGALLQGKGEIWLDDVQLEVVGQDVPTTNPYEQRPLNLDFENPK